MEEYNFNTDGTNHANDGQKETPQMTGEDVSTNTSVGSPDKKETKNPQIPSDEAPFVVLCGPPASGKSMVLKCLASYLYGSNYSISANKTLLSDVEYQQNCDIFNSIISDTNIPMPNTVDYLMADIMDKLGNVKAHFLEAPGEDFFSLDKWQSEPNRPFKGYLAKVAQISPKKFRKVIYIILLDLDSDISLRNDPNRRQKYEQKMIKLYNKYVLNHPSKVILLYNKVDIPKEGKWGNSEGCFNPKAVFADAKQNYPLLFFSKKFLFWDINNYTFLPFCTGSYEDGYTAAGPAYPESLWNEISKLW